MENFVKKPCKHCPFRNDVKPYLHPDRSWEIANIATNPYSSFPCHKTTEYDEDSEDGYMIETEKSKQCAGMLTMRAQLGERIPSGFEPSWEMCYIDPYDMTSAYEEEWNKTHKTKSKDNE